MHESDESWEKMIETVKKEIVDEMHRFGEKKEGTGEIIYKPLFRKYMIIWDCRSGT